MERFFQDSHLAARAGKFSILQTLGSRGDLLQ
jgi:hypothetical protein